MNYIRRYDGDKIIGELEWDTRPGATYEMHLDVDPAYHRKGIGRSMFEELDCIVWQRKGMSIYSFAAWDNEKAKAFFRAMGFTLTLAKGFYGEGRDAYFMHKTVGKPV